MYKIYFYKRSDGVKPVRNYIDELKARRDKDSRIKLNKIEDYIQSLRENGLQLREPHIKHLDGKIWELRPLRDRILFVAWHNDSFILLHHFVKKNAKDACKRNRKGKAGVSRNYKRKRQL